MLVLYTPYFNKINKQTGLIYSKHFMLRDFLIVGLHFLKITNQIYPSRKQLPLNIWKVSVTFTLRHGAPDTTSSNTWEQDRG